MKHKKHKTNSQSKLKVAIVTDPIIQHKNWYTELKYIIETFPNSEIFTPYYKPELVQVEFSNIRIHDTFLQLVAPEENNTETWLKLERVAYKTLRIRSFDLVISISSRGARFIKTKKNLKHIGIIIEPKRLFNKKRLHRKEIKTLQSLDAVITSSNSNKRKIKRLYGVTADVLYPPIEVEKFKPKKLLHRKENWYLATTDMSNRALTMLIKATVKANTPLKIIGPLKPNLEVDQLIKEYKARGLVKFIGDIPHEARIELMQRCRAFIYPIKSRRFGRIPIEANAAGTPVIAYKRGSVIETISTQYPKTGIFFNKYNYKSLSKTLENFNDDEFDSKNCIMKAEEYDSSIFMYKLKTYVEDIVQNN
jgi:glycosyltransferase involved in cell wall biosynthesis